MPRSIEGGRSSGQDRRHSTTCAVLGCEEVTTCTLVTGLDVGALHTTIEIPLCPAHDKSLFRCRCDFW